MGRRGATNLKMQNTIQKSLRLEVYREIFSAAFYNIIVPYLSFVLSCERRRDCFDLPSLSYTFFGIGGGGGGGEGVVSEKSGSACSFVPLTLPSSPTPLGAALRERDGFFPSQFTS